MLTMTLNSFYTMNQKLQILASAAEFFLFLFFDNILYSTSMMQKVITNFKTLASARLLLYSTAKQTLASGVLNIEN